MTANTQRRRPAGGESGYAMLMVFLIAAMIAIALYNEMPRVAFEAQRTREQLLIERGEQYKRAIQLFVRKMSRYPATIEELENTNNIRFLRKRYIDPMTGKDKWRLIHINGGVLTDSIVPKNKPGQGPGQGQDPTQQANTNTFIGEGPVMGATNDPTQQQINPGMRRRPSDDRPVVAQEAPEAAPTDGDDNSASDADNNSDNSNNNEENAAPGTPGAAAALPGVPNQQIPGMPPGRIPQPGMFPGQPGFNPAAAQQFGANGAMPNQVSNPGITGGFPNNTNSQSSDSSSSSGVYAAPGLGSQPATTNTGATMANGMGGQPGSPGMPPGFPGQAGAFPGRPGMLPGQAGGFGGQQMPGAFGGQSAFNNSNSSGGQQTTNAFNNNFGLNGPSNIQQPGQSLPGMGGTQMGGGIAGVASEYTGPAIKIYNERKKYNEWEFVYDQSKDRGLAGVQRGGGAPGTPAGQMGNMPGQMPGQQGSGFGGQTGSAFGGQSGSAFGGQSGSAFGGQSGGAFGGASSGFGQPPQQQQPQPPQN